MELGIGGVRLGVGSVVKEAHLELSAGAVHPHTLLVIKGDKGLEEGYRALDWMHAHCWRRGRRSGEE